MPQQQGNSMPETRPNQRFHSLNAEQVEVLHQVLSEVVPIHGRGNFPTLELRPRDIIIAVRTRLQKQGITVRDVRLNGSTASHVLVRDNGTSYKDLDIIFGVELPSQEEFQVIKESVLGCLLECLPAGVNRERISSATMKEAYVQKMVKVFNEYDRWSLISLSNNSGKNLELKFVSVLRRQFEFSVDSFQIILDRLLESYIQQESQHKSNVDLQGQPAENPNKDSPALLKQATAPEMQKSTTGDSSRKREAQITQTKQKDEVNEKQSQTELSQQKEPSTLTKRSMVENDDKDTTPTELKVSEHRETLNETHMFHQPSPNALSEEKKNSEEAEPLTQLELRHESELCVKTKCSIKMEQSEQLQPCAGQKPAHSNQEDPSSLKEQPEHTKPTDEEKERAEHTGQSEALKTSIKSQTESLKAKERQSAGLSECFREDQRGHEEDKTQHASPQDSSTSSHAKMETQLADDRKVETDTREPADGENDMEISEVTEDNLALEAKNTDDLQSIDCSCSTSSISLNTQPTGKQDTLESHSAVHTDNSDKTPDTLDTVSPPDAQDILPAQPSLVSDKKTSSPPSGKTSDRLSHMVVLKHTSPKPPRRMCRKVASDHYPGAGPENETGIAPCLDPNPCPSPEPHIAFDPNPAATSSHPKNTMTTAVSTQAKPEPEPNTSSNVSSNLDLTSAPDPAPDIISTSDMDPVSGLPQEPPSSQLITEASCKTIDRSPEETPSTHLAFDDGIQSSHTEAAPASKQLEPLDLVLVSHTDTSSSNPQELVHTSEVELCDEDENGELQAKNMDLNQTNSSPQETTFSSPSSSHCATPLVSCLSPSVTNPSPPDFTFSPPSISPPPWLTPQSHCLSSPELSIVSPATSLNSPPLSFSPTSSCLSSPPYLTPPMLSLSPPPACLSPPLLCLTPPVETEDLVLQVSSDMEPLILNTGGGKQIKEPSLQPGVPDSHLEDKKEQDHISSLPLVAEPVPITFPNSTSAVLLQSQCGGPEESAPPKADEASIGVPENIGVPKVTTGRTEQSNSPHACDSVPAVEVLAESMYGDFEAAMNHLRYHLIATRNPEEIRGGGLLKYSNLLVRDYRPASETQIKTLERYMCSRFFIDFPDVQEQQRKILSYLKNHFIGEERSKYQYLMTLRRVVDDSTVCLMGHERRQTLNMITVLALKVLGEQNIIPNTDHVTCFYQPAPYLAEHSAPYLAEPSYCSYYIPQGGSTLLYQPYPLHLHTQTGIV